MFRQERPYWCGPAALVALQLELGVGPTLTQTEWAALAGTTSRGTGPVGLKRALRLLTRFHVAHRRAQPFSLGIVFDHWRDHWITVRGAPGAAVVLDPWDGSVTGHPWGWFRHVYLSSARRSYALICGVGAFAQSG